MVSWEKRIFVFMHLLIVRLIGEPSRASAEPSAVPNHHQRGKLDCSRTVHTTRLIIEQEKLNEAIVLLNKGLQVILSWSVTEFGLILTQEINIQNMNVELVAQMFKNYQSNVLFHLEGRDSINYSCEL
jgi:DASH complex subunit DAD4